MNLALNIIAKDENGQLNRILNDYGKYFDEICIGYDGDTLPTFDYPDLNIRVFKYDWCDDFAHKRNWLAERTESPYYFRMDTDDSIENPEIIRKYFDEMVANDIDVLYVMYDYAKDENGNVVAKHWRETIVRKKEGIYWKKAIHENVFIENLSAARITRTKDIKIIHNIDESHAERSSARNFEYLYKEFIRDKENTDPRTLAYLGRMLMGRQDYMKAIFFLEKLIEKSGWSDDKYFAYIQMAQCYQFMGQFDVSIACCNEALAINTKFPDAYIQMGTVYLQKGDYPKSVDWLMSGIVRPEPDTVMVIDPTFYKLAAKINAAMACLGIGDLKMAMKCISEAKAYSPQNEEVLKYEALVKEAVETEEYMKNVTWIAHYLRMKEPSRLRNLIDSIPSSIKDERVWGLRHLFLPPRKWAKNEIAIFCGSAWEDWSPVSVLNGIGGSEEAVIYLSKELVKLGYKVTVFNSCGDMSGIFDGVEYKPYQAFNPNDIYSTIISWRGYEMKNIKADKKLMWLHDVPIDGMFSKDGIESLDKIIVLSEYHKSLLPDFIPDEKVFVSSNGINLEDFNMNGTIRNPRKIIYTSSYDRGLEHLLKMWPDIRKEVPDAELHIFYGWNTYDKMVASGARDGMFKKMMVPMMMQEGVKEHGRIGHKKLINEFQSSGIWAYPSHFEEISCISAMKAQACGCVPVTTDYAALAETVKEGIKISGKAGEKDVSMRFKEEITKILKDEERQEEIRKSVINHKDEFGWDKVAIQWKENLL